MDQIEVRYGRGEIPSFQKEILNRKLCALFLQMIFVSGKERDVAVVKLENYHPILSVEEMSEAEALDVMISLCGGMLEAERRCIFVGDYRVDSGVLCVDPEKHCARLVFMPRNNATRVAILQDIISLMLFMEKRMPGGSGKYIREAINYVSKGHGGISRIRQRLVMIRRKVSMVGEE